MPDGFGNPIAGGGGSLIRPSLHSPDFATGSTGWSINKDGTAEFNGVTIRGTIILGNGTTNTIILDNVRDAIFVYDNAGKLTDSISPSSGIDAFGNAYTAGIVSYLSTNLSVFSKLIAGNLFLTTGDVGDKGFKIFSTGADGGGGTGPSADQPFVAFVSPTNAGSPTPITSQIEMIGEDAPQARSPMIRMRQAGILTDMDVLIQGTLKYSAPGATNWAETWHRVNATGGAAPAFNVNWANSGGAFGNVSYLRTADGCVKLAGVCQYTGAAAAPQTIFTIPAGYRPNRDVPMEVTALGADGAFQASEVLIIRSTGAVVLTSWTGTGIITPITLESVEFPLTV